MVWPTSRSDAAPRDDASLGADESNDVGTFLCGREVRQLRRVHVTEKAVENRTIRFEVETLDVEHAAVARLHDHGDPTIARSLANEELHVERVALFDDEVEPVEELAQVLRTHVRQVQR